LVDHVAGHPRAVPNSHFAIEFFGGRVFFGHGLFLSVWWMRVVSIACSLFKNHLL
jgi:hypothetical protein